MFYTIGLLLARKVLMWKGRRWERELKILIEKNHWENDNKSGLN